MVVARLAKSSLALSLALALGLTACGERPAAKRGDITPADVIAGAAQSLDHYESAEGKFAVDFPPVWKGNYVAAAHTDTTNGARGLIEFSFKPDAAWKVEPRTLLAVRIFTPASWAKVAANPKQNVGVKLKERGNDVYVLSLAGSNPYAAGTPANALFDKMMLAVVNDVPLRLTPR